MRDGNKVSEIVGDTIMEIHKSRMNYLVREADMTFNIDEIRALITENLHPENQPKFKENGTGGV